jgi:hypothetical protein
VRAASGIPRDAAFALDGQKIRPRHMGLQLKPILTFLLAEAKLSEILFILSKI